MAHRRYYQRNFRKKNRRKKNRTDEFDSGKDTTKKREFLYCWIGPMLRCVVCIQMKRNISMVRRPFSNFKAFHYAIRFITIKYNIASWLSVGGQRFGMNLFQFFLDQVSGSNAFLSFSFSLAYTHTHFSFYLFITHNFIWSFWPFFQNIFEILTTCGIVYLKLIKFYIFDCIAMHSISIVKCLLVD